MGAKDATTEAASATGTAINTVSFGCAPDCAPQFSMDMKESTPKNVAAPVLRKAERWCAPYRLQPLLDLQDTLGQLISHKHTGNNLSLQAAALAVLGVDLGKSKQMQISDWEARPLLPAQLLYAATDAAALLWMFVPLAASHHRTPDDTSLLGRVFTDQLFVWDVPANSVLRKYRRSTPGGKTGNASSAVTKATRGVTTRTIKPKAVINFAGVFLSKESRATLLEWALPPHTTRSNKQLKQMRKV